MNSAGKKKKKKKKKKNSPTQKNIHGRKFLRKQQKEQYTQVSYLQNITPRERCIQV